MRRVGRACAVDDAAVASGERLLRGSGIIARAVWYCGPGNWKHGEATGGWGDGRGKSRLEARIQTPQCSREGWRCSRGNFL